MSHLDPSSLAQYNSLVDPHLQSYFSNERIQSHLKHAGLISNRGEIISDGEYRTRLARREHKKHVRHMLAENILNRAIDMERMRRAEMKRQYEMVAKAALVNNIKESRRRSETFAGLMSNSVDMALVSLDSSWLQTRPKSANCQNESNEQIRIPRLQSALTDDHQRGKSLSKTGNRRRSRRRLKNRSLSKQNRHSRRKSPDSSSNPCQITMVYYGPKLKVDYDHLVFEPIDEVIVMQQHCGGENVIVYKEHLKSGAEFTFDSRRHSDYPFGLTLYVKGFIDSRISTCCEYKHRHGVRLGGDRGHFAIKSVKGSKPCIKCRFEKQARLKRYADSPKDKTNENKKPITISLSASDEPKVPQTPIKIPVRRTSTSNENYSEDFDGSDKQKHSIRDDYSSDEEKSKLSKRVSSITRKQIERKYSSTSDETPKEKLEKKTWQIQFYITNIPKEKYFSIKFSLISNDQNKETEIYEINKKQFDQNSKGDKQYSFTIKLKNIGKPEQIRLKIFISDNNDDDDEEEEEDIKWYLDHIELIDPENQSHLIFPCKQWIRPLQEKILRLSQKSPRNERIRRTSSSTNDSRPSSSNDKIRQKKTSARSSTSSNVSKEPQQKSNSIDRILPDNQSEKSTPRNNQENKIPYRVTIYPSNDDDGSFNPVRDSRIYLRLNNQTKEMNLIKTNDQSCPIFESGEKQSFEINFIQNINEKPKKLTIGYINSDITAMKWKLDKIILCNLKTNDEFIFPCKQVLQRDETNFRAEKTFEIQSKDSDEESTPKYQKINSPKSNDEKQRTNDHSKQKSSSLKKIIDDSDEEQIETPKTPQTKTNNTQKSSLLQELSDNDSDEEQIENQKNLQRKTNEIRKSSLLQKLSNDSSDEEQIEIWKKKEINMNNTQKSSLSEKLNDNDNKEPIETPKKQQTNDFSKEKSSSFKKTNEQNNNNEEQIETSKKQQTNSYNKQKSPSFQSMNDEEADYRKIFKELDPDDQLKLGSPRHSPTPRPKTRHGRQEQNSMPAVDPLIGLDDLNNQTARSNDPQNQISLSSTTTNNGKNRFEKWRPNSDDDDNE